MKRHRSDDSFDSRPRKRKKRKSSESSDSEEQSFEEEEGSVRVRTGDMIREDRYKVMGVAGANQCFVFLGSPEIFF